MKIHVPKFLPPGNEDKIDMKKPSKAVWKDREEEVAAFTSMIQKASKIDLNEKVHFDSFRQEIRFKFDRLMEKRAADAARLAKELEDDKIVFSDEED